MTVLIENHRKASRLGRKGLSATMAVVVLGVAVVATGVAGYVVLTAVTHTTSSSERTCSPSSSLQCGGKAHAASDALVPRLTPAATSRG